MTDRPLIAIVDDRPHGLAAMSEAIERRYGSDYRVIARTSARELLGALEDARTQGDEVALVIADQWMPEMTGSELLERAHLLHPNAQRALLVGWGDTRSNETVLQGCARGVLDNYVLKPWAPAEVHLYPAIGEFLAEWTRANRPPLELIRMICDTPTQRTTELREMLERNAIPHGYYDVSSEAGRALAEKVGLSREQLPALVTFDGRVLQDPSNAELADLFGVSTVDDSTCDLAIVGAGPCGLAAAVYAGSEGLRTILVERAAIGGQASASSLIRNFLGFPRGISGADLTSRAYQQGWLFGAKFLFTPAHALRRDGDKRIVVLDNGREIQASAVLVATGAAYRRLGVPRVQRFDGVGVYYTAGADIATALIGQDIVVCGGGNSAGQAVAHLAKKVRRVIHIVRAGSLAESMSAYLIDQISRLPNVELRFHTEVVDADGERGLEQVTLHNRRTGERYVVPTRALFVMIGGVPHTDWLGDFVELDRSGYIVTGPDLHGDGLRAFTHRPPMLLETSVPGVFAAGDVRLGSTKRLASAVGEGAVVLRVVQDYLAQLSSRSTHAVAA